MSLKPLTYGTLPSEDEFREAFGKLMERERETLFQFVNDPRVGTCELTGLWRQGGRLHWRRC